MNTKRTFSVLSILVVVMLLLTSCRLPFGIGEKAGDLLEPVQDLLNPDDTGQPEQQPTVIVIPPEITVSPENIYSEPFAEYVQKGYSIPTAYQGGYTLPLNPGQVEIPEWFDFSDTQYQALLENGFFVAPPDFSPNRVYQEFYQLYESARYLESPVFITTDSVFHVYHLIFDKMLRDLERTSFIDTLKELTTAMVDASLAQYNALAGSDLQEAALRNLAYFAVPALILDLPVSVPEAALSLAQQELALIEGQGGFAVSPIWAMEGQSETEQLLEDYSQYIPRGHYTRDDALKTYFKAMMWYGRLTFRLKDAFETQRALLVVQAMRSASTSSGRSALELWQNIYDPTVFIVGKADDLSIYEYGQLSDQVFGQSPQLTAFADAQLVEAFRQAARQLPPPQINSMWVYIWEDRDVATQGFRFMGQRFTLDAYVFGQLIWRKVGTLDNPRDLPKSLDVLAAMGSDEAYTILDEMGETQYENYDSQMSKVKTEVAGFGLDSWTQNLYWTWLYALQPVFEPKGTQYPAFMQTQAWLRKDMQTALGSWTELKHDTILYAKQVMAEMGGGENDEPPRGYVEPNPEAYARLLALAEMTRSGLEDRGILDDTTRANLENLIDELEFLLAISEKELSGVERTADEYWRIQYYGGWLESMTVAAADPADETTGREQVQDQKSALVADVATGIESVLEQGVGFPTPIYVVLPDQPYEVALGAVYTYYEFTVSPDNRLTDEAWQEMLESGQAPDAPDWTQSFIIP